MGHRKSTSKQQASVTLARHMTQLAVATPQVMAHRLERMATAKTPLSSRDQKEFQRMTWEKVSAFSESWLRMWLELGRIQQQWLWRWMWSTPTMIWGTSRGTSGFPQLPSHSQITQAGTQIFKAGLAPVHRTAHANAKRLNRLRTT